MICPVCGALLDVFTNVHARKHGFANKKEFFEKYGTDFMGNPSKIIVTSASESRRIQRESFVFRDSEYGGGGKYGKGFSIM